MNPEAPRVTLTPVKCCLQFVSLTYRRFPEELRDIIKINIERTCTLTVLHGFWMVRGQSCTGS